MQKKKESEATKKNKKFKIKYIILVMILIILLLILLSVILNEEKFEVINYIQNNVNNNTIENNVINNNTPQENNIIPNKTQVDKNNVILINNSVDNSTVENNVIENNNTENTNNSVDENNNIGNNTVQPKPPENEEVISDIYTILSENKEWEEIQNINVFKNIYYTNAIIAPGVEGSYKFHVNNGLVVPMRYAIQFEEYNNKNINMKYKLKYGNTYLVDEWTDIENIVLPVFQIPCLARIQYEIEWKWEDSDNDTEIGLNASEAIYNLKISVTSTEI